MLASLFPDSALGWIGACTALGLIFLLTDPFNMATTSDGMAESTSEETGEATCRVCYGGAEAGRLFSPCRCSGTMRYVHVHCLNAWRVASVNPRSFFSCDQCGYSYRTKRTVVAELLQSDKFVWMVSWLLVVFLILFASMIPGALLHAALLQPTLS